MILRAVQPVPAFYNALAVGIQRPRDLDTPLLQGKPRLRQTCFPGRSVHARLLMLTGSIPVSVEGGRYVEDPGGRRPRHTLQSAV